MRFANDYKGPAGKVQRLIHFKAGNTVIKNLTEPKYLLNWSNYAMKGAYYQPTGFENDDHFSILNNEKLGAIIVEQVARPTQYAQKGNTEHKQVEQTENYKPLFPKAMPQKLADLSTTEIASPPLADKELDLQQTSFKSMNNTI